jgi:hypothetical protein
VKPHVKVLLKIPGFLETAEDVEIILTVVRLRREEKNKRMLAAEHAVAWSTLLLDILAQKSINDLTVERGAIDLQLSQDELSIAAEELLEADKDIGLVRFLARKKGLPLPIGPICDDDAHQTKSDPQYGDTDSADSFCGDYSAEESDT